jgi:hypothetical protein
MASRARRRQTRTVPWGIRLVHAGIALSLLVTAIWAGALVYRFVHIVMPDKELKNREQNSGTRSLLLGLLAIQLLSTGPCA